MQRKVRAPGIKAPGNAWKVRVLESAAENNRL